MSPDTGPAADAHAGIPIGRYQTKADLVYSSLRRLVLTAQLRPGEVIDQARLSSSLGVSRMPLRQALTRLEADGLVFLTPHHSATVAPLLASDIEEVYATREVLETLLIETGVPKLTDQDCADLEQLCRRTQEFATNGPPPEFASVDRQFHTRLYAVAGYERTLSYFERLRDLSDRYVAFYYVQQREEYAHDAGLSAHSHDEMLEACRSGDVTAAVTAMRTDLRRTAEHLMRIANSSSENRSGS